MTSDRIPPGATGASSPAPKAAEAETFDFMGFVRAAKKILWNSAIREKLERQGISLTPARFYNDIPTIAELREGFETREPAPYLMEFMDKAAQARMLEALMPFAPEFDPPQQPSEDGLRFGWQNGMFSNLDAMAYYCMLRHFRPRRVLEIGSGNSTRVALEALTRNGTGEIVSIEPFPSEALRKMPITLHQGFAQDFDADFFNDQLADGDVFFIDSTHTVKASSDCCHLYLRILPWLRRDVIVHVHDIALPKGISVTNAVEKHVYWTEQYLLAALLCDNPKTEFLLGVVYANICARPAVERLMGGKARTGGGSFWFRWHGTRSVARG